MTPGGQTRPYAVLGHPIAHTLSPRLHNAAFAALGLDAIYLAFDVAPTDLLGVLGAMCRMGFGGVNLTVPLKEVAFRGLAELDESARRAGAVNTVRLGPGGMRGHNTDGYGFLRALEEAFGTTPAGQSVVVLGAGGSARTLAGVCAAAGARSITIVARNREKAEALAGGLRAAVPGIAVSVAGDADSQPGAVRAGDLVIQATPVGLRETDPPLFGADAFRRGQRLYDLVYTFPETATMAAARVAGAEAANGLGMLLHQGARAFEILTGLAAPLEAMREALEKAVA